MINKNMLNAETGRLTLPAGTYFFGDPSYVLQDHIYQQAIDTVGVHRNEVYFGEVEDKVIFACVMTANGDGTFPVTGADSNGFVENPSIQVDSGLISVIPIDLTDHELASESVQTGTGLIVEFDHEVEFFRAPEEAVVLGNVVVVDSIESDEEVEED